MRLLERSSEAGWGAVLVDLLPVLAAVWIPALNFLPESRGQTDAFVLLAITWAAWRGAIPAGLAAAWLGSLLLLLLPVTGSLFAPLTYATAGNALLVGAAGTLLALLVGSLRQKIIDLRTALRITEENNAREAEAHHMALENAMRLATHDQLTGVPNRRVLEDRFIQAAPRALREGSFIGMLVIDIADFRKINDQHGHAAGDAMLRSVGGKLAATLRQEDTVARIGGNEFAIMLVGLKSTEGLAEAARRLVESLDVPMRLPGVMRPVQQSVNVGIASFPRDGIDLPDLLQHADDQLNRAKTAGIALAQFARSH